jgi:cbb3-type cytochrome oxidase subunit 3
VGVEIFPVISLLIFSIFFAAVIFMVIRMSKKEVADLSNLPLEDTYQSEKNQIIE